MEKVVYILGAGFSAPLGLPVMSNFLSKAKDAYFGDPSKYSHFEKVFQTIAGMHVAKSYFEADLLNIEEILSVLEMRNGLSGRRNSGDVTRFILDVIQHYTPQPPPPKALFPHESGPSGWGRKVFNDNNWGHCAAFVTSLFGVECRAHFPPGGNPFIVFSGKSSGEFCYSVVTLNYDHVLEGVCEYINSHYPRSVERLKFQRELNWTGQSNVIRVPLAKLHGSVDSNQIIAPTWSKTLTKSIRTDWQIAFREIATANHIRVLGYSLPISDSYIKYLLKSAIVESKHLKTIDVICRGNGKFPRQNYDDFVTFKNYRYAAVDLADYFRAVYSATLESVSGVYQFDRLETTHGSFMEKS